jgi:hypothetical protein
LALWGREDPEVRSRAATSLTILGVFLTAMSLTVIHWRGLIIPFSAVLVALAIRATHNKRIKRETPKPLPGIRTG